VIRSRMRSAIICSSSFFSREMFTARASETGYQVYPLATLCPCTASELVPLTKKNRIFDLLIRMTPCNNTSERDLSFRRFQKNVYSCLQLMVNFCPPLLWGKRYISNSIKSKNNITLPSELEHVCCPLFG